MKRILLCPIFYDYCAVDSTYDQGFLLSKKRGLSLGLLPARIFRVTATVRLITTIPICLLAICCCTVLLYSTVIDGMIIESQTGSVTWTTLVKASEHSSNRLITQLVQSVRRGTEQIFFSHDCSCSSRVYRTTVQFSITGWNGGEYRHTLTSVKTSIW